MTVAISSTVVRLPAWRARFVLISLVTGFVILIGRTVYLQTMRTEFLQEKGEQRYARVIDIQATRGRILDRSGEALAVSTPVKSIWAIPEDFEATEQQKVALAHLLAMSTDDLRHRLEGEKRDFLYLKRQVSPDVARSVEMLEVPGIYQQQEFRRYYPGGEVTAHLIGFTGVEDKGQEGVELAYQARLGGKLGSRRVIKDRLGRIVEDSGSIRAAQDGSDLTLALDSKLQSIAFAALKDAVKAHKAKAGALVVVDPRTGEIVALANIPSYNPNNRSHLTGAELRNRVVTDSFEPGSTLKPFAIALALDRGLVTPQSVINTAAGSLQIANHVVKDVHAEAALTVAQVIQKSSNVGAARIALGLPREDMWSLFHRVGFGSAPDLGFPGAVGGKLRPWKTWRPIEQATMAYGHGISVSLLQLARAYTVFARDGDMVPLTLERMANPPQGTRVISVTAAREMRAMLETVTQVGGTAPRARIMGWRVAGKTGTAHKQENGGYAASRYLSSFVGFGPVSNPRLVIAVAIDEPTAGQHYGGTVAAPVFAQVMQSALRILGVPNDAPLIPIEIPGEAREVKEGT